MNIRARIELFRAKKNRIYHLIDVASPFDTRILEKIQTENKRLCRLKARNQESKELPKVEIVPVVIGTLGTVSKNFLIG